MKSPSRSWIICFGAIIVAVGAALATGCASKHPSTPAPGSATRTYRMGFSSFPPRPDFAVALQNIQMWTMRADAAIEHIEPPWDSLLAGADPVRLIQNDKLSLVQYYRAHGLTVTIELDPTNGLDRASDATLLRDRGHSITEPAVQALFIAYALAVDSLLTPNSLGLASETNLVRAAAPDSFYRALVSLAQHTADALAAAHVRHPRANLPVLYTSVQVETAWGRFGGSGSYQGISRDLADFPFGTVLGLSSYPYLGGFAEPEDLPADYFARIAHEAGRPVMVVEGGWASASRGTFTSSPAKQARDVRRMASLLDAAGAIGWYQLDFADLQLSAYPPQPAGSILPLFASLGLVDTTFTSKPALAPWDSVYKRTRVN